MREARVFRTGEDDAGRRLDRVLKRLLPTRGLSEIYASLRSGRIRVDSRKASPSDRLVPGASISVDASLFGEDGPGRAGDGNSKASGEPSAASSDYESLVVFRTRDLVFLDKPRGLLVHGGEAGAGSLEDLVRGSGDVADPDSLSFVQGPLHRLDRNTSGLVAFARSARGARIFSDFLARGLVHKSYLALLDGRMENTELWEDALVRDSGERRSRVAGPGEEGGREARSSCLPLLELGDRTLALISIGTGRTHQIRAQAAHHGHPLAGDSKYGGSLLDRGYLLHAWRLAFEDRPFPDCPPEILAPLPVDFRAVLLAGASPAELDSALDRARLGATRFSFSIADSTHTER